MTFNVWSPEKWATALWRYFLPQIQTGRPFYFSIDSTLLQELVLSDEPNRSDDPIQHLARSCQELIFIRGRRVHLCYERLRVAPALGESNVICLVALQVAAVELMTQDESYSGRAYFPRLRELLDIGDKGIPSSDPFYHRQFDEIWARFKIEILGHPGASARSITFHKGKGRNLHRELPLSQALLTAEELARLYSRFDSQLPKFSSPMDAFLFIRSKKGVFNQRTQNIIKAAINNEDLAFRLGSQILEFLENPLVISETYLSRTAKVEGRFIAFRSMEFFGEESINVYYVDENGNRQNDLTFIKIGESCKEEGKCILFIEDDSVFNQCSDNSMLCGGESILILCHASKELVIRETIKLCSDGSDLLDNIDCSLPSGFIALYGNYDGHASFDLSFKSGRLFFCDSKNDARSIKLIGGILIDGRKNEYLSPFSPKSFLVDGKELNIGASVEVNGERRTVYDFRKELENLSALSRAHYSVSFGRFYVEFEMRESLSENMPKQLLGFPINIDIIQPTLTTIDPGADSLVGMAITAKRNIARLSRRKSKEVYAALSLLFINNGNSGVHVSDDEIKIISDFLGKNKFPDFLVNKAISKLEKIKTIRPEIRNVLFHNK
ncbi:hypothetical protein ACFL2V_10120 [Pseudomonadota bacterium]